MTTPDQTLPEEPTQAHRFEQARTARGSAILEARRLGVSHATAVKTIARLRREGLATGKPYRGVFLTAAGHALADRVRTRHRLVVDLLLALGVPPEAAETDAEGIEHYVSDATLGAFARFLRRPG
jgi:DtxR family manganese transport transcriptional regulator